MVVTLCQLVDADYGPGLLDELASLIGGFHRRRVEIAICGENTHAEKSSEEK